VGTGVVLQSKFILNPKYTKSFEKSLKNLYQTRNYRWLRLRSATVTGSRSLSEAEMSDIHHFTNPTKEVHNEST